MRSNSNLNSKLNILSTVLLILILSIFILPTILLYKSYEVPASFALKDYSKNQETTILIKDGVDVKSGLIADANFELVRKNCTSCHNSKIIQQNKATKEGWKETIRWMQTTQGLWDLGENEELILKYLAKNYAPQKRGRRKKLSNIEWYDLK